MTTYGYDAADALTSLQWALGGNPLGDLTYAYDLAGRRVMVAGSFARTNIPPALTAATYDLGDRLLTWDGTSYTYDPNGNLTGDGTTSYTWNARNQLTVIAGGASGGFTYDAVGRRTSRTVGGVTTNYLYDGVDAVQEQIGGSPSANYLLGLGIDERFTRTDGTGTIGYLTDALGSSVALTDATGALATVYTYEAYGVTTQGGVGSANPARYTGREEDGTGLYYYRARYYDARTQRFASEDSVGFVAGGVNLYEYANGSPTSVTDPTGHWAFLVLPIAGCIGGGAGAGLGNWMAGRKFSWRDVAQGCGIGAGIGLAAAAVGMGAGGAAAAAGGAGAEGAGAGAGAEAAADGIWEGARRAAANTYNQGGKKALERALRSLERNVAEHLQKIQQVTERGGNADSMAREVRAWRDQIDAIKQLIDQVGR